MILITWGHNRLIFQTKNNLTITDEQLDLLVEGLLPTMQEFFDSEIGESIYAEYLKENYNTEKQAAWIFRSENFLTKIYSLSL